jgi:ArsR family transcriptional regulator
MSKIESDISGVAAGLDPAEVSSVLKALSNPNRLRMFLLVRDASPDECTGVGLCVGDLADQLEISQSTVSHYLKELEHAGLVKLERSGKNVFCTAVCDPLSEVLDFLVCAETAE